MCSKHVEAWNNLIVKQKFYASSWLITEKLNMFFLLYFHVIPAAGGPSGQKHVAYY